MQSNYMFADLWAMMKAIMVFPLFVVVPGYVAGWVSNVLEFRRRRTITQLVLSTPLSLAICPVVTFWCGRFGGYKAIWTFYALIWVTFVVLVLSKFRKFDRPLLRGAEGWAPVAVLVWLLVAVGSLMHLQIGDRLYFNNAAFDYCVRSAFTASAVRAIPPANPFFAAFGDVPLRYHYFWMMMCALPAKLLHIHPLFALYGGAVWVGIGLISTIAVFVKFVLCESERVAQKALLGAGLLFVTGLDLLGTAYLFLAKGFLLAEPEWWNLQVTSWLASMLWVPHYVAALIACLVGFLFLLEAGRSKHRSGAAILISGLSFASGAGLGVYVTLVFAVFCAFWILICLSRRWRTEAAIVVASGLVSIVAAAPHLYLWTAHGTSGSDANTLQAQFARFAVRPFMPVLLALLEHGYTNRQLLPIINLLLLPLNYALEFGFFLLVGILQFREQNRKFGALSRETVACWTLLASSLLIGSFVTSTTLASNDLGIRCMLPAQFVLLLWAAPILHEWQLNESKRPKSRAVRTLAWLTLVLGICATLYEGAVLRTMSLYVDNNTAIGRCFLRWPGFGTWQGNSGSRTLALRKAYDAVRAELPPNALVQANPANPDYAPQLLFDDFPAASGQANCGVVFGGDSQKCSPVNEAFAHLFGDPQPQDGADLDQFCLAYRTSALLVADTDAVWQVNTWVWSRPVLYANDHVRVFRCGKAFSAASSTVTGQ